MAAFLRTHALALFFALVVGICTVAPIILAPLALGEDFRGILYTPLNDEDIYRARINEVLDGHFGVTSPFLYDYKDSPILWPPVNEWLYALPAFIFGLSAVVIASKFLLPASLFFLIYLLTRKLLGEDRRAELCALAAGLVATLGIVFVDYQYMAWFFAGKEVAPVMWTRLVNPITGGVELFLFLILLWRMWEKRARYLFVAAGILHALMIGYYFSFALGLAILGMLFLFAAYDKDWRLARQFIYVGVISFFLDSWIWYNVFSSIGGEAGKVLSMRNGMFYTHEPVLNKALLLATVFSALCFAYVFWITKRREQLRSWLFIFALIGASWLAFNEQVITGRQIWYHHFVQYTVPISMISVIGASYLAFKDLVPRLVSGGMIVLAAISVAYGIVSIKSYARDIPLWHASEQRYGDIASWLNGHAPEDCVVMDMQDDVLLSRAISAYTSCNSYFTDVSYTGVPEERTIHNTHVRMAIAEVSLQEAEAYLNEHQEKVRNDFYPDWNAMFGWDTKPWIGERIASLAEGYQQFSETSLKDQIQKYRVDYVISNVPLRPDITRAVPLKYLSNAGEYRIYTFDTAE